MICLNEPEGETECRTKMEWEECEIRVRFAGIGKRVGAFFDLVWMLFSGVACLKMWKEKLRRGISTACKEAEKGKEVCFYGCKGS